MGRYYRFFREFIRHPRHTGAIMPSSRYLAREMLRQLDAREGEAFAEYGAGEGSFTAPALSALARRNKFFAIEINPRFAARLRERFPQLSLREGCASRVAEFCRAEGVDKLDGVLSGLPWAAFSEELQDKLLLPMLEVLRPGGRFVTFAYVHALRLPAARRFRNKLETMFDEVQCGRIVWRNVPPAVCYLARTAPAE